MPREKEDVVNREQTTIRLPSELKDKVQALADANGISFNAAIIILLRMALGLE